MRALVSHVSAEAFSGLRCCLHAMSSLSPPKPLGPRLSSLLRQWRMGSLPILGCVYMLVVLSCLMNGNSTTAQEPGNAVSVCGLHRAGF